MAGMRERADELGGRWIIEQSQMGGTRVSASLPCSGSGVDVHEPSTDLER